MSVLDYKKKINKLIKKSKVVFVMGHKNLDLDAIGSCIGMYSVLRKLGKDVYIIVDDTDLEQGVEKVLHEIDGVFNIIKGSDIPVYLERKSKSNLLIIVDTNKEELVQSKKALEYFSDNLMVLDHHELGKGSLDEGLLIIDDNTSSASEMVVEVANMFSVKLEPYVASILLSGIVLDTNNFTLKTTAETYYKAYFLAMHGASPRKVQYLLKQDIEEYTEQHKLLTNIEKIGKVAIAKGASTIYRREDLARTADTLLFFNDVEASFVIGKIGKSSVGVSVRSLGNFNISRILKELPGGGDSRTGAAVFEDKSISEVHQIIKKLITKEGE